MRSRKRSCGAMMNDVAVLRDLLREDALAATEQSSSGKRLSSWRSQKNRPYQLSITGVPHDTVAFKTDRFPPPTSVFNNRRGECKRADYVIVALDEGKGWIVYVEMKRGHGNRAAIERQLRGAKCVVSYCRAIVEQFWRERRFLQDCDERFVSVRDVRTDKQPTRRRRSRHDNPEDMLLLTAPTGTLRFETLLHGRPADSLQRKEHLR